ncbi:hypothetical protein AYL99_08495 [Fonsecaea erecta]|uniref:Uncharacterized protein n=1 Tax=Fonsecaea erecta TaxID=1367422 RepID=A0A178ZDA0_9EURO|nr:hypothetical protein AYL99_08495 [Fonsecaea erecta]OAP57757.1 hypothetical protein AYL99_08495 [Fonsecaea erecta]
MDHSYSDNDINVTSQSAIHMTLCLRSATQLIPQDVSHASLRPFPLRTTPYAERSVKKPNNATSLDPVSGTRLGRSTLRAFSHPSHYQPPPPNLEDIPTFIFGRPSVDQTNSKHLHPRIAANRYQTPVHQDRGGYAADRSEEESEMEYDPATKAHFKQHLGIIDCSGAHRSRDRTSPEAKNSALLDYETQLRLLEEQNRRRLKDPNDARYMNAQT